MEYGGKSWNGNVEMRLVVVNTGGLGGGMVGCLLYADKKGVGGLDFP